MGGADKSSWFINDEPWDDVNDLGMCDRSFPGKTTLLRPSQRAHPLGFIANGSSKRGLRP